MTKFLKIIQLILIFSHVLPVLVIAQKDDEVLSDQIIAQKSKINAITGTAQRAASALELERALVENKWKAVNDKVDKTAFDLDEHKKLTDKIESLKKEEAEKIATVEKGTWIAYKLDEVLFMAGKKQKKGYKRLTKELEKFYSMATPTVKTPTTAEVDVKEPSPATAKTGDNPSDYYSYRLSDDLILNPPKPPCVLTFDDVDPILQRKRKEVAPSTLFDYTPVALRNILKDKPYLHCEGWLTSATGGLLALHLKIEVASKNALAEFGRLDRNSLLTLKMISGDVIKFTNNVGNTARFDEQKQVYVYEAQYMVTSSNEKTLRKEEPDVLRIVWSTGYEDYPLYNLDFFMNQFDCLD